MKCFIDYYNVNYWNFVPCVRAKFSICIECCCYASTLTLCIWNLNSVFVFVSKFKKNNFNQRTWSFHAEIFQSNLKTNCALLCSVYQANELSHDCRWILIKYQLTYLSRRHPYSGNAYLVCFTLKKICIHCREFKIFIGNGEKRQTLKWITTKNRFHIYWICSWKIHYVFCSFLFILIIFCYLIYIKKWYL